MSNKNDSKLMNSSMVSEDMPASLKEKFNQAGSMNLRNSLFKETSSINNDTNELKNEFFKSLGKNNENQNS